MYPNPLVLLVTLLLNLARPITCTGQSPKWVYNDQERQLFLPGTHERREGNWGPFPTCQLHPRGPAGWQGLGLLHRYSGRKAGCKQGTAPSTRETTSLSPGTRKRCTQPTQWTTLEPSLQQEIKNAGFGVLPSMAVLGVRSSRSCRPPPWLIVPHTISIWPAVQSSVARPLLLWPQSFGKGQRGKGKPWEQKQS